ncbi:hypothetical protein TWF225_002359 [Orbilia oligospora]|nr:hypothetical protein TWF225_002359 [Orbilia oligospora]KAF3244773.1 hypothetical protein TWF217_010617 [Orbilia oligospora]KAF3288899.1 hypothetical protein TWF132_007776 [Orbilia oligospora]
MAWNIIYMPSSASSHLPGPSSSKAETSESEIERPITRGSVALLGYELSLLVGWQAPMPISPLLHHSSLFSTSLIAIIVAIRRHFQPSDPSPPEPDAGSLSSSPFENVYIFRFLQFAFFFDSRRPSSFLPLRSATIRGAITQTHSDAIFSRQ